MTQTMNATAWQRMQELAHKDGLTGAQMAGLAIGCPKHGNAGMDWDDAGVFCHTCESAKS
jgi:hypothetical protein